ncbi:MAG: DUF4234 domain-containing protein [Oscillospiraceae bacterium]
MTYLRTDRNLFSYILLSIITCGIYGIYYTWSLNKDLDPIAEGDGEKQPEFIMLVLLTIVTCGIYYYYWLYKYGNRLNLALNRKYGIPSQENGTTYLLWWIVGSLICGIGQFIGMYLLIKNVNMAAIAYNTRIQG